MIQVRFDKKNFDKTMRNAIDYSIGFLEGSEKNTIVFNTKLAGIAEKALNKFIDAKAKAYPESLHHIYEWGKVGQPSGRLFKITAKPTKVNIIFTGEFLPSNTVSETSDVPFYDKANIMENKIAITVEPRLADFLAFDINGEQVFTTNAVFIENPGGDEVAGSFGRVVEEFFDVYFTTTILQQSGIFRQLEFPRAFSRRFSSGGRIGRTEGRKAGAEYMNISGDII